jgi:hypothetical protein
MESPCCCFGLPLASLGRAKQDCLIAGGGLGGDVAWLLERVPEEVATSTPSRALHAALRQRALATLASMGFSRG